MKGLHINFNGSAGDDSLLKIGELKFHVKNNDGANILPMAIVSSESFTVKITGSGYMYRGTLDSQTDIASSFTGTTTSGYRLSLGEYDVSVISKYPITSITLGSINCSGIITMDISELNYLQDLTQLTIIRKGFTGKTDDLAKHEGMSFNGLDTSIIGDVKNLAKLSLINDTLIVGYFGSIGAITQHGISDTGITGKVEDFVSNCISGNYSKTFLVGANTLTLNSIKRNTLSIGIGSNGDAVVKERATSTTLASYTKDTNIWTYN